MSCVSVWSVIYIVNNHSGKLFIPVYSTKREDELGFKQPAWFGFCINTGRENEYDPILKICDVKIPYNANKGYLRYDSYIDVGRARIELERDLLDYRGEVDPSTRKRILDYSLKCPSLEEKYKSGIRHAFCI